ncbi:MAG: hypothetical protein LBL71_02140 [Endomicrobium sp.]|jgi:hypothetical protein|nr:hypothetical protein [Endomicrobium sp.]
MKKITILILVLGLAMPAQAWTLFPVRKEIVTVKETNYALTAVCAAIPTILSIVIFMWGFKKYDDTAKKFSDEIITANQLCIKTINDTVTAFSSTVRLLYLIVNGKIAVVHTTDGADADGEEDKNDEEETEAEAK